MCPQICLPALILWIIFLGYVSCGINGRRFSIQFSNSTFMDEISRDAIIRMHDELDTDEDGNVSVDEGAVYSKMEMMESSEKNANLAGFQTDVDGRISEEEFWENWLHSEAHNWTNTEMLTWLKYDVELPQYTSIFHSLNISGSAFPILACNGSIVSGLVEGSKENRLKLMLIAKQVVLFGPAKQKANFWKDAILTVSLLLALSGMFFGMQVKRNANRTIESIQEKMRQLQSSIDTMEVENEIDKLWTREISNVPDDERSRGSNSGESEDSLTMISVNDAEASNFKLAEVMRELDSTKEALRNAEREVQKKACELPSALYDLLKTTYDVESKLFDMKRKKVQEDLEQTKAQFQKIERNRSTLLGILQVVHSRHVDSFDSKVQQTRDEFVELQKIMKERRKRWTTIEAICKFRIKSSRSGQTASRGKTTSDDEILSSLDTMSLASMSPPNSLIQRSKKNKRPSMTIGSDEERDTVSLLSFNGHQKKSPVPTRKSGTLPNNVSAPSHLSSFGDLKKGKNTDPSKVPQRKSSGITHSQSTKELPHLSLPENGNQTFPKRSPVARKRSQIPNFNGKEKSSSGGSLPVQQSPTPNSEKDRVPPIEHTEALTPSKRSTSVQSLPSTQKNGLEVTNSLKSRLKANGAIESLALAHVASSSTPVAIEKGRKSNFLKRAFFQKKNKEKTSK